MSRADETVGQFGAAQERLVGKFCSNCRMHRQTEGGRLLGGGRKRTRWVCKWCAEKYDQAMARRVPVPD
jgi:hypothetical protein